MAERPALSVVVPTYNAPELLKGLLHSMGQQTLPAGEVEIVVVDDASPGFDPAGWNALSSPHHLIVIHRDVNGGRARARNDGIRAATGEVIVFLDGDMTAPPGFLNAHLDFHRLHPGEVAVGNILFAPQIEPSALTRYVQRRGVQRYGAGEPVPYKCFVTGNSSVSRQLLKDADGFDEDFHAYGGEDLELGFRLARLGAVFRFAAQAVSYHHHLRPLEQQCQLMYTYGRHSLPILLDKHPQLAPLLRLDFLDAGGQSLRRWALRAALWPPVYALVYSLVRVGFGGALPDVFFDYLWWRNRTRGFMEARVGGG